MVNPQRDLADARQAYGITASDVLLAPTLREAWAVIAPMLAGCTPLGFGIDETLGLIDFELKRLGHVTDCRWGPMCLGLPVRRRQRWSGRGLRWQRMHDRTSTGARRRSTNPNRRNLFGPACQPRSRRADAIGRSSARAVGVTAREPRDLSAVVLHGIPAADVQVAAETAWIAAARQSVADQLCAAAARATLTDVAVARLQEAGKLLGVDIVSGACILERHDIDAVLIPGCANLFHRDGANNAAGRVVERDEMERLAKTAGLAPVKSVSKTRCEVLVTAEPGSQSCGEGAQGSGVGQAGVLGRRFLRVARGQWHSGSVKRWPTSAGRFGRPVVLPW